MLAVSMGTYTLSKYDPEYTVNEVAVYARVHPDFPDWTGNRKGFVTAPPLERADGSLNNNPWACEVEKAVDKIEDGPVQSYSWNWSNMPMDEGEDLAGAHDLVQRMFQHG